jgi:uncharacterized protein
MSDNVWEKDIEEPKDPCVRQCGVSSSTGYCRGCYMTLDEISKWSGWNEWERRKCLENIEERKKPK